MWRVNRIVVGDVEKIDRIKSMESNVSGKRVDPFLEN